VSAEAERNADVKFTEYPIGSDCPVVSDGGAIPSSERAKDCGVRTGYFSTRLYYYPLISSRNDDDDLFVPIGPGDGYPLKDFLKLETANDQLFIDPRDGSGVTDLEEAYANCPFLLEDAYTPKTGNMYTSANKFPEKRLFDKSRKKLVVSGSKIRKHNGEKTTGQTILAWNLRLTRVN